MVARARTQEGSVMKKYRTGMMLAAVLGFLVSASLATPTFAETGAVAVVFTKGGFIVGVGGGQGVLTFRGKKYPFTVSGMSVGFTIGASTSKANSATCLACIIIMTISSEMRCRLDCRRSIAKYPNTTRRPSPDHFAGTRRDASCASL